MSDVEFDTDFQTRRPSLQGGIPSVGVPSSYPRGMMGWLMKHHITQSEGSATTLLAGFISINFILTGLIVYFYVLH